MQGSAIVRNVLLGGLALLATASMMIGATVPSKKALSKTDGSAAQNETGAIFSDSVIAEMAGASAGTGSDSGKQEAKARDLYAHGVQVLLRGRAAEAERDALKAAADGGFSDAYALAATAELSQRKFTQAQTMAQEALTVDASNAKAYVILATADNYLGQYADAVAALENVQAESAQWWQVLYQRARAEAGLNHIPAAVDWSNQAALQAPQNFAPLHLLHASALVAMTQYAQAADELETYLTLKGNAAPQRVELQRELDRLRELAGQMAKN